VCVCVCKFALVCFDVVLRCERVSTSSYRPLKLPYTRSVRCVWRGKRALQNNTPVCAQPKSWDAAAIVCLVCVCVCACVCVRAGSLSLLCSL
jgi:hypothetical protein